jgi:hypothetical protein
MPEYTFDHPFRHSAVRIEQGPFSRRARVTIDRSPDGVADLNALIAELQVARGEIEVELARLDDEAAEVAGCR